MNENSRWSRFTTRTTLITVAALAGVVIAGGAAVAANIGILDAADDDNLGTLSAAGVPSGETQIIDVYPEDSTSTTVDDSLGATREFAVDRAGLVTVAERSGVLRVAEVAANPGWTWSIGADDATTVAVTLTDGTRTLVFTATLAADGTIVGDVAETTPSTSTGATTSSPSDDDDEDDEDDDHDEDDEHEGRDDDD